MVVTFSVSAVSYGVWRMYIQASIEKRPLPHAEWVEPLMFTLSAALAGGGQMIVHTKLLAEMIELMASTGEIVLAGWFFWVELTCVLVFGVYWLVRLTQCLGMYDPLFIIPLMQTAFIIFGAVAGGIFFKEFEYTHKHPDVGAGAWAFYAIGLLMAVGGLCLIAPLSTEARPPYTSETLQPRLAPTVATVSTSTQHTTGVAMEPPRKAQRTSSTSCASSAATMVACTPVQTFGTTEGGGQA